MCKKREKKEKERKSRLQFYIGLFVRQEQWKNNMLLSDFLRC